MQINMVKTLLPKVNYHMYLEVIYILCCKVTLRRSYFNLFLASWDSSARNVKKDRGIKKRIHRNQILFIVLLGTTVKPRLMVTWVIWSPSYYGHFVFAIWQKLPVISCKKKTSLIRLNFFLPIGDLINRVLLYFFNWDHRHE